MQIAKDSTQTIVAYPKTLELVSSATVRVETDAVGLPDATSAATVESATLNTTTNADALEGDTRLFLASAVPSVVIGRSYVVDVVGIGAFTVEVAGVNVAADEVELAQPLPKAVASGSAFRGWALTHALTTTQTAAAGLAFGRWAVAGVDAVEWTEAFRIVAHANHYALTWSLLSQRKPHLADEKPAYDETGAETIAAAWDDHLIPALEGKGVRPAFIISQERLMPAHAAAVELVLFPRDEVINAAFERKVDQALRSKAFWYDANEGEVEDLSPGDEGNGGEFVGVRFTR